MLHTTPSGLLIIDKPQGVTSFDAVAAVRGALHIKKVGHAGTLDPMATGTLVIAFGHATRLHVHHHRRHQRRGDQILPEGHAGGAHAELLRQDRLKRVAGREHQAGRQHQQRAHGGGAGVRRGNLVQWSSFP